jgi:hypothetical protein
LTGTLKCYKSTAKTLEWSETSGAQVPDVSAADLQSKWRKCVYVVTAAGDKVHPGGWIFFKAEQVEFMNFCKHGSQALIVKQDLIHFGRVEDILLPSSTICKPVVVMKKARILNQKNIRLNMPEVRLDEPVVAVSPEVCICYS